MRRGTVRLLSAAAMLAVAIPVVAQQAPESLLPPGFGDPAPEQPQGQPGPQQPPARRPEASPDIAPLPLSQPPGVAPTLPGTVEAIADNAGEADDALARQLKYDMPPGAQRSLGRIGALTVETGGIAPQAFGGSYGPWLARLLQDTHAPFASRWGSILLRRALLSATDTPRGIDPADWVAERAWMLLRMGEADAARMLVQNVDNDHYSPRLFAVAMNSFLATADPAGLCPITAAAAQKSEARGWQLAKAMCASFSGDQGLASAALNQAQRNGEGVDYRLAEKIVGTGFNARRSVTVEWTGVSRLTVWRFGLATAANLDIPDALFATAGWQVRAWQARSAMLSLSKRLPGVEMAARQGVFSSRALVDFYAQLAEDPDAPQSFDGVGDALRTAFAGGTTRERLSGMQTLWARNNNDYVYRIATARAAAAIPVNPAVGGDSVNLIASMLSAGYDRNAARWAGAVGQIEGKPGLDAWALVALGAPGASLPGGNRLADFFSNDNSGDYLRSRLLAAGLAGLGRIRVADAQGTVEGLNLGARNHWTQAIDEAAARGEQGTVALLCAVGMQTSRWSNIPPVTLYHVVAALKRVGLEPEARMIAAEALARV